MKITDIKAYILTCEFNSSWPLIDRQVSPTDYYEEFHKVPISYSQSVYINPKKGFIENIMIEIETDEGISGIHLPVNQFMQAESVLKVYKPTLIGMNPLEIRTIRDKLDRISSSGRTGALMAAISAIDCALWDLLGKAAGLPVFRLLGGGRKRIQPYISTLGCNTDDAVLVKEWAQKVKEMGVWGQKWFFKYGPGSGVKGMEKNIELAYTVREAVGENANIMFDAWAAWDLTYCLDIFKKLEGANPYWIEEPLRADRVDAFKVLKEKSNIKISSGEKLMNRFEVHAFLKESLIDFYQPEPEFAGGITEIMRMGEMCETYGAKFFPHGMSLLPILSVSAAMAPDITPCFEYLMRTVPGFVAPLKDPPDIIDGFVELDERPGLFHLDEDKIIKKTEILL